MEVLQKRGNSAIIKDGKRYYTTADGKDIIKHKDLTAAVLAFNGIKYNIDTVTIIMDNVDLSDYGIAECEECGETCMLDEMCTEHGEGNICRRCCEECRHEQAEGDYYERQVDEHRYGY